ncbi:MAG: type II toxin-antitoxin system VapC family toxin [Nitrospirota bacterium]
MTYLDTSALIKRFVAEKGSGVVRSLVGRKEPVATAKIAYVEVFAGLARKRREGHLSANRHALICRQFERDWQAYIRVDLMDQVLMLARDLIRRHPLRGFDAVHLASAMMLKNETREPVVFAAADEQLLRAAKAEKLGVLDVEKTQPPLSLV